MPYIVIDTYPCIATKELNKMAACPQVIDITKKRKFKLL